MSYFNPGKRGWSASGRELARCWGGHDHVTEVLGEKEGKKKKKAFLNGILLPPKAKRPLRLITNTNPYLAAVLCRMRHAGLVLVSVM